MPGRDVHSILLQTCAQVITATGMGQNCDSEFLSTDLRAELALCPHSDPSDCPRCSGSYWALFYLFSAEGANSHLQAEGVFLPKVRIRTFLWALKR